jgi:hypothetical protein
MHSTSFAVRLIMASVPLPTPLPPHSVSGFSAGASAAINHLVAFSSAVQGIGIVGGSPYGCNIVPNSGYSCSGFAVADRVGGKHLENKSIPWDSWLKTLCRPYLEARAARGLVDPLANLVGKPVYLLSGLDDVVGMSCIAPPLNLTVSCILSVLQWVYQPVMRVALAIGAAALQTPCAL